MIRPLIPRIANGVNEPLSSEKARELSANQPVYLSGVEKRLEELSLFEDVGRVADSGMASMSELEEICTELRKLAEDPTVLYGLSCMIQVTGINDA